MLCYAFMHRDFPVGIFRQQLSDVYLKPQSINSVNKDSFRANLTGSCNTRFRRNRSPDSKTAVLEGTD